MNDTEVLGRIDELVAALEEHRTRGEVAHQLGAGATASELGGHV